MTHGEPDHTTERCLRVELRAARIPVIGRFAHHHWLVVIEGGQATRWEVWQHRHAGGESWGYLHRNLLPWAAGVGNGPSWPVHVWQDAAARDLADRLARAPQDYPWRDRYWAWPGPNSNTFAQWVLGERFALPWQGIGRRWRRRRRP